ncbi:MAG: aspartate aminotransferase family protein [Desulfovibrio sp.]|jgi:glutamate-1-semialdehyde 2,1-aminomutase|nr:aspartate aminotransferase family protein [Desulfovibrio sp.]
MIALESLILEYTERTPKSAELYGKACRALPGGVSANIKFFEPYPIFMDRGEGAWLTDVDGNRYVDYLLSYGPLALGHGHPAVKEAIREQFNRHGSLLYGTPHALETEYAEKIKQHFPSIELLRYTNSGTEATLLSLRMAYACTGKYKIGKFEGHYHGGYNQVLISVNPPLAQAGEAGRPSPVPESAGLEPHQFDNTVVLPFDDLEACSDILREHKDDMAAVIMEPLLAGYIVPTAEFMRGLRKVTEELGILLVFDEVKTGFRAGLGGAQGYFGIRPDLTALGKVIGAGMPMGIVGGKKELLLKSAPIRGSDVFDMSAGKRSAAKDVLFHSGTYNGDPLILRAGLASMEILEKEFEPMTTRTESLKQGLKAIFAAKGIPVNLPGLGTVFNIAITDKQTIGSYRDMQGADLTLRKKIDFALFREGIYNKPTNRYSLSTAHDETVIDFTLEAYKKALARF